MRNEAFGEGEGPQDTLVLCEGVPWWTLLEFWEKEQGLTIMGVAETLVEYMESCDTFNVTDLEGQAMYGGQRVDHNLGKLKNQSLICVGRWRF